MNGDTSEGRMVGGRAPSNANYSTHIGEAVYKSTGSVDEYTLLTDNSILPAGAIQDADDELGGALRICKRGRCRGVAGATLTVGTDVTVSVNDGVNAKLIPGTTTKYIVGFNESTVTVLAGEDFPLYVDPQAWTVPT